MTRSITRSIRLLSLPLSLWSLLGCPALAEKPRAPLIKLPVTICAAMENTPFVFGNRPLLALNYRDDTKHDADGYKASMYLFLHDLRTGQEIARFGEGHSFVNAFVNGPELNVFASEGTDRDWFQSIYRFTSTDLKTWKRELAIPQEGGEHLFNCSLCRDDQGFLSLLRHGRSGHLVQRASGHVRRAHAAVLRQLFPRGDCGRQRNHQALRSKELLLNGPEPTTGLSVRSTSPENLT